MVLLYCVGFIVVNYLTFMGLSYLFYKMLTHAKNASKKESQHDYQK